MLTLYEEPDACFSDAAVVGRTANVLTLVRLRHVTIHEQH